MVVTLDKKGDHKSTISYKKEDKAFKDTPIFEKKQEDYSTWYRRSKIFNANCWRSLLLVGIVLPFNTIILSKIAGRGEG